MITLDDIKAKLNVLRSRVSSLRRVSVGDYVMVRDVNDVVLCCKQASDLIHDILEYLSSRGILMPDVVIDSVNDVDTKVGRLPTVMAGDVVDVSHHNNTVDAIRAIYRAVNLLIKYMPQKMLVIDKGLGTELSVLSISARPSGLDPNDPLWRPIFGWTQILDFTNVDEKFAFCVSGCRYCNVRDHMLVFDGVPQGDFGACYYWNPYLRLRRIAFAMKIDVIESGDEGFEVDIGIRDIYGRSVVVRIYTVPNDLSKLRFYVNGNDWILPLGGKWFALVIDTEYGWLAVYDQNRNKLLEVDFAWLDFRYGLDTWIAIYEDNQLFYNVGRVTVDTSIDWVCLYYMIPWGAV